MGFHAKKNKSRKAAMAGGIVAAGIIAASVAGAATASNSVPSQDQMVGEGAAAVTGFEISGIDYTLGDGNVLDSVGFNIDNRELNTEDQVRVMLVDGDALSQAGDVVIDLNGAADAVDGTWFECVVQTADSTFDVVCPVDGVLAEWVNTFRVVIAD